MSEPIGRILYLQTPNLPKTPIGGGDGLTAEAKQALLACFENVAWEGTDGRDYYNDLETALYSSANVVSIAAVFTQGSAVIYDTDSLDTLRQYLTVTATYDDQSTRAISSYTLSGTLSDGTSTITAEYSGKTASFSVTVTGVQRDLIYETPLVMFEYDSNSTATVEWDENSQTGSVTNPIRAEYPALVSNELLYKYSDVANKTLHFSSTVSVSGVTEGTSGSGLIVQIALFNSANPTSIIPPVIVDRHNVVPPIKENGTHTPSITAKVSDLFSNATANSYLGFIFCLNRDTGSIAISNITAEVY